MSSPIDNYDDLNELVGDEDVADSGNDSELFHQATTYVQSAAGTLDNSVLLKLYAFYKQVFEGPCNPDNRPSWYDFRAKAKYEAWRALGAMPKAEARSKYIEVVQGLGHDFTKGDNTGDNDGTKENVGWVIHSTLQQSGANEDSENDVCDPNMKTLIDLISSNDLPSVKQLLSKHATLLTQASGNSHLTAAHYAADRGCASILEHVLSLSMHQDSLNEREGERDAIIIINITDDDGQTPLHYASACGHADCCKVLLKYGANIALKDNDGQSCLDVAADDEIKKLLLKKKVGK